MKEILLKTYMANIFLMSPGNVPLFSLQTLELVTKLIQNRSYDQCF